MKIPFFSLMLIFLFFCSPSYADSRKKSVQTAPSTIDTQTYQPPSSTSYGRTSSLVIAPVLGYFGAGQNILTGRVNGTDVTESFTLSGFLGLGVDAEYLLKENFGVGGMLRYYSTSDSISGSERSHRLVTIAGNTKGYFTSGDLIFGVGPGLAILMPGAKSGNNEISIDMGFGLTWSIGCFYKLSSSLSVGIENTKILGLGERLNGWILDDFMFKGRFFL